MRAELRGLYSDDVPGDLGAYRPNDLENFYLEVRAIVGSNDGDNEDEFRFSVCSPQWLAEHPPEKGFWFLQGHLLLTRWDAGVLERALSDLCLHTTGPNWQWVAEGLSRYAWTWDRA